MVRTIGDNPALRSKVIGQILNIFSIYEVEARAKQSDEWQSKCAKDIALMLAKELYPTSAPVAAEFQKAPGFQFEDLTGDILYLQMKSRNVKEKVQQIRLLATTLVEAFKYQYQGEAVNITPNPAGTTTSVSSEVYQERPPYPFAFVQQALLTFFWMKAEKSEEIEALLQAMPAIASGSKLGGTYTEEWYTNFKKAIEGSPEEAEKALSNLGDAFYFTVIHKFKTNPLPPIFSFNQAHYPATYPDCVETSIRNFFHIILYYNSQDISSHAAEGEPATLNIEEDHQKGVLKYLPKNSSPALLQYFQDYNITDASKTIYHDNWSRVVSDLNKNKNCLSTDETCVVYARSLPPSTENTYEIYANIPNTLKVFGHLFQDKTFFDKTLALKDKLDYLCKLVSRPGFTLTWDIYQKKDKSALLDVNEKIIFSINGAPLFNWKFTEGHSDIQSEAHVSDPALLRILTELQKGAPTLFKIKMMEKLFPDLSEQTKNKLFDKYSKAYSLIYSLYFSDNLYQYSTLVSYLNPGSIETNPGTWYYVEPLLSSYSMPIYSRVLNMCLDYNIDNENMINSYVSTVQFNHETKVNPPSLWPETLKKITHLNYRTPFVRDINNAQYYAFVFENSPNLENMGFTSLLKDLSDGNQFPGKEFKPYDIDKLLSTLSTQKLTSLSLTLPADNELKGKAAKFVFGQKDLTDLLLSSEDPNNISYLNGLSELTNLQKLTFYNFSFERYIQYPKLLEYMLSKINKNNLEFLSFSRCNLNKLTEQGWFILLEFLSSVPHLKTITISGDFTNSSPALFQKLWATFIGMPELKEIEFNFKVSNLNKVFLDKFVETLKNKGINVKQNEFLN